MIGRRAFGLVPMGAAVLAAALVSAGQSPPPAPGAAPAAVRIAIFGNPATLDPALATTPSETAVTDNVFPPLLAPAGSGGSASSLATVVTVTPYAITLRLGRVAFADGTPLTARAAAQALARALTVHSAVAAALLQPVVGSARVLAGRSSQLTGVAVQGRHTLVITLKQPLGESFLSSLANPVLGLVAPQAMAQGGPFWQLENLDGAGGYRLLRWTPGQGLTFVKVRGGGAPLVQLEEFSDWALALASFRNGLVDAVPVAPAQLSEVGALTTALHYLPTGGAESWYGPWASAGLPAWVAGVSPRRVVAAALGEKVRPLSANWPWPATGAGTQTVWVASDDPIGLALARALADASGGRLRVAQASAALIRAGVAAGTVREYVGTQNWFKPGTGQKVALAPRGAFWLLAPGISGARAFADGNLIWHSLRWAASGGHPSAG